MKNQFKINSVKSIKIILEELFRILRGRCKPTQLYLRTGFSSPAQVFFFLICGGLQCVIQGLCKALKCKIINVIECKFKFCILNKINVKNCLTWLGLTLWKRKIVQSNPFSLFPPRFNHSSSTSNVLWCDVNQPESICNEESLL